MQKRKSQGFTVLQIVALDPERDVEMRNPSDWIIDKAAEYGFYILLLPVWGQLVVGDNWAGGVFPKTVIEENSYGYGEFIGKRYKHKKHILWCLGGDRQPIHKGVDYKNVYRKMAKGVLDKDVKYNEKDPSWEELLITYHACHEAETGDCSTLSYWNGEEEAWISFNYEIVAKEYTKPRVRPVWDGEPAYEMMITTFPPVNESYHGTWMVRRRAYFSMFSGSFGHTYGHASVWCSIGEKERGIMTKYSWYEALQSEGSMQMKLLRQIMEYLALMTAVGQDGSEEMNSLVAVCVNPSGKFVCLYLPSGGSVTLDLNELPIRLDNPSDGKFYDSGCKIVEEPLKVPTESGKVALSAPSAGEEKDWVLILMTQQTQPPIKDRVFYEMEKEKDNKVFDW
ncbi:hypothetical protein M9Y10_033893 [Tritrichomonas musculus]|uniref:Apiosidase-like catalytic domain-containing protein n=1 Tax=Tritrichomonas musculus TaxID=1915356 RepID=A0ABR2KDD4_9EUKA